MIKEALFKLGYGNEEFGTWNLVPCFFILLVIVFSTYLQFSGVLQ